MPPKPPQALSTSLSPGLRSAVSRFEKAVKERAIHMERDGCCPGFCCWQKNYDKATLALRRKLLRMEGKLPPVTQGRKAGQPNERHRDEL